MNFLVATVFWLVNAVAFRAANPVFLKPVAIDAKKCPITFFQKAIVLGFCLSGVAAMFYEIAWTRTLCMILGTTTFAFTTMLATFLAGIAIGSACYGMIPRSISRSKLFITLQLIIPLSVILTIPLFEKLPLVYLMLDVRWGGSWAHMQWLRFLLAASVMFVPTVAMGALLPTVSSIFIEKTGHLGARLGQAYGFNTLGNVIGAVAAGLLLIPAVGMQNTIMLGAVLNLIAGFGIYMMESSVSFKRRIAGVISAGSIAVLLLCMVQPWSPKIMSSGVYVYAGRYHETQERYQKAARLSNDVAEMSSWRIWEAAMGVDELLYYDPGITATVAVMESKEGVDFSPWTAKRMRARGEERHAHPGRDRPTAAAVSRPSR